MEIITAKNLIIYYSRNGQNYVNGAIKNLTKGNTEIVAEYIRKAVGGNLFEIETVKAYSADYMTCTEEAQEKLRVKARPELKAYLDDISGAHRALRDCYLTHAVYEKLNEKDAAPE